MATKKQPFGASKENITLLEEALCQATQRPRGLRLRITRLCGVEVKPAVMKINNEKILVKKKGGRIWILTGSHGLELCGGMKAKIELIQWATAFCTKKEEGVFSAANPDVQFSHV